MDYALFQFVNRFAGRWPALDELMRFVATDYMVPTIVISIILFLWFSGQSVLQERALLAIVSVALANGIVALSNAIWFRARPFTTHEDVTLLFYHPSDSSFPANSMATTWALAWAIRGVDRRAGNLLVGLAATMGLGRVFVGVHYPLDIVAGAGIGILAARFVAGRLAPRLSPALQWVITVARRLRLA